MNIGDYITSGILHDYCLGVLTIEEEKKVEIMCSEYPAVAKELHLLQQSLEKYSSNETFLHRDELRMKVWEAVKKIWEDKP
jgi:anti-sigma-K factor RskA